MVAEDCELSLLDGDENHPLLFEVTHLPKKSVSSC